MAAKIWGTSAFGVRWVPTAGPGLINETVREIINQGTGLDVAVKADVYERTQGVRSPAGDPATQQTTNVPKFVAASALQDTSTTAAGVTTTVDRFVTRREFFQTVQPAVCVCDAPTAPHQSRPGTLITTQGDCSLAATHRCTSPCPPSTTRTVNART